MRETIGVLSEVAQLFRDLIEMLVDDPDHVSVSEVPGTSSSIIEVKVGGGEMGRLLGRRGRLADAIREIARCVGWREQRQYKLDVFEGESTPAGAQAPRRAARDFHDQDVKLILERIIRRLVNLPSSVEVDVLSGKQAALIEVTVDLLDTKRLIGKGGATADAIRVILFCLGRARRRYWLEIVEPIERVGNRED